MRLYSIFDRLAEEAGPIFECKNDTVALRMYQGVGLPGNREDYKLCCIGEYDHETMRIISFEYPSEVVSAVKEVEEK